MSNPSVHPLVPGSIKEIYEGSKGGEVWVQVIFLKQVDRESASGNIRYKAVVSDSKHFMNSMVVAPMSLAVEQKIIEHYSIIKLTNYHQSVVKNHTFLVISNFATDDVIHAGSKYGEPINVEQTAAPSSNSNAAATTTTTEPIKKPEVSGTNPGNETFALDAPPVTTYAKSNPFVSNIGKMGDGVGSRSNFATAPSTFGVSGGSSSGTGSGTGAGGYYEEPEALQTIANLSPYHNRWSIKARIINKSEIKKFANAKGEGKLFSCTCIDGTGEIRMTAFGETVDKFFDIVQDGQVYFISSAQVKIAKRQFGVRNEYEIHLEPTSLVTPARDSGEVPSLRYNFVSISNITSIEKDGNCDIIGVVKETSELSSITTKTTNKQLNKRDLTLVDTSGCSIKLTLWGVQAEQFHDSGDYPVLAVRNARVSDFNGKSLSASAASTITKNPDIHEAHELRGWYDAQGVNLETRPISSSSVQGQTLAGHGTFKDDRKTVAQIKEDHLGQGEKPDFFSLLATIVYIKSDSAISYTACPSEGCNKKVTEEGPNMWRCEKCSKVYDRCDHRYIISLQVADHTGQTWLNAFNETGEQLLGKTAEEMYYLRVNDDPSYATIFKEALFKGYLFRIRAKQENYQGEMKLRCNVLAALPINVEEESKLLVEKLSKQA